MAQRVGGTLLFRINGVQYPARGEFKYSPLMYAKTGVAGQDGVHGYTEKPVVPSIEGTLTDLGGISISNLATLVGFVCTLELANGKVVVGTDCWVSDAPTAETEDGKYPIKVEGMNIQEIISI
jgi:hypothetical protein